MGIFKRQMVSEKEPFRKYPSYMESFQDNAHVLKQLLSKRRLLLCWGLEKQYKFVPRCNCLVNRSLATDPSYNAKLNNVITAYNLTQYDTPSSGEILGAEQLIQEQAARTINQERTRTIL